MAINDGAYIDLKNVEFFLRDGYSETGAVNNVAGYSIGASTILVDGIIGVVGSGLPVTFAGHATVYTITGSSLTSGNTTSLTITPVLTDALVDNEVFTIGAHEIYVKIGDGNLTYSEKVNREYKMDRGKLDQVRNGDEVPMDVNFQFAFIYVSSPTGSTTPTIEEFFKQKGPAAAYTSSGGVCQPYCVDIVMVNKGNPDTCGIITEPVETIILREFRYESLDHDVKAGTVSATGKCNIQEAEVTRSAA